MTVKEGLADLSGNLSDEYNFRFLSEYRGIEEQETVLALDDVSGFWAPDGSGSSAGLTQEANSIAKLLVRPDGHGRRMDDTRIL